MSIKHLASRTLRVKGVKLIKIANSLVGSTLTCSPVALQATRVRVPVWGPFPMPSPSLPLNFLSVFYYPILIKVKKKKKNVKNNITCV